LATSNGQIKENKTAFLANAKVLTQES